MKKTSKIIHCIIIFQLYSCNSPPRDRRATDPNASGNYLPNNPYSNAVDNKKDDSSDNTTTEEDPKKEDETTITVVDANKTTNDTVGSDCQFSKDGINNFRYSSSHLGNYNICKGSNVGEILFQLQTPETTVQITFTPTNSPDGSSSKYIGEPRKANIRDTQIYKLTLYANRPNYTNLPINGVMIIKDKAYFFDRPFYQYAMALDAYLYCSNFLAQHNDQSYCQAFKNVGAYRHHPL